MRVVLGNNDGHAGWPLTLNLTRGGVAFHLVHIPPRRAPKGTRVLLHGHTHVPRDEIDVAGTRWLNPGCISYPRAGVRSFAWVEVEERSFRWELVKL